MLEVARLALLRAYRAFLCDGRSPVSPGTRWDVFPLPPQAHLCGTFQTPGERDRAMGAFFRTGLVGGEHCMIAVDIADPDDILAAIGSPAGRRPAA